MTKAIDRYFPRLGPCFCGCGYDGRHRQIDIIREWVAAGDSVEDVAEDQGVSVEAVLACLEWQKESDRCAGDR